jgi:hypothetical protein
VVVSAGTCSVLDFDLVLVGIVMVVVAWNLRSSTTLTVRMLVLDCVTVLVSTNELILVSAATDIVTTGFVVLADETIIEVEVTVMERVVVLVGEVTVLVFLVTVLVTVVVFATALLTHITMRTPRSRKISILSRRTRQGGIGTEKRTLESPLPHEPHPNTPIQVW